MHLKPHFKCQNPITCIHLLIIEIPKYSERNSGHPACVSVLPPCMSAHPRLYECAPRLYECTPPLRLYGCAPRLYECAHRLHKCAPRLYECAPRLCECAPCLYECAPACMSVHTVPPILSVLLFLTLTLSHCQYETIRLSVCCTLSAC